ncbi:YdcF family protein [Gordonia neofelifaecis]|uniref:DUF218 domain-containing protein n=1 Tax=Gordonia neofelifaecis NRRL B-59395 TaxID=644548 RepID=F1YP66_9ACTN|nr:YdcF family protein [Gordonia neofelifaecis]EGD53515.1 hypothetical protein SCNU_18362 [Gordonia neofelifaecis NRRL B-59395]
MHSTFATARADRRSRRGRRAGVVLGSLAVASTMAVLAAPTAAAAPPVTTAPDQGTTSPAKPKPKPSPGKFLAANPPGRYIVVLGARMETLGNPPKILAQRLDRAASLARANPFNRIIVTGGNSWWLPVPEAMFMHAQLAQRGVTPLKVIEEPTAMSTVENAQRTVAMLKGLNASGAVIVTNDFHMKRALDNFRDEAKRQNTRLTFVPSYA